MRVAPDDDVYRVNAVWLGPRGLTFPWTARYLAYATWLVTFLVILLVEAVVPPLHVGVPPVWEFSITTLFTYGVMSFVDHERPVRAVWQTFLVDLGAPRPSGKSRPTRLQTKVRVHERPRHDRRLTRAYFAGTEHTVPTHAARYAGKRPGAPPTSGTQAPLPPRPRRPRRPVPGVEGGESRTSTTRSGTTRTEQPGAPRQARADGAAGVETMARPAKSTRFRRRRGVQPPDPGHRPDGQGRR